METITRTLERKKAEGATDTAIWEWLETLVITLDAEGMSSDETDIDDNTGALVLRVRNPDWRRRVEKEMDFVDQQRVDDKELFSNKGSKPTLRLRKDCLGKTRRNPPTGKPKAVFDMSYLKNHKNPRKLKLSEMNMPWINISIPESKTKKRG